MEMSTTGCTTITSPMQILPARRRIRRHSNSPSMLARLIRSRRPMLLLPVKPSLSPRYGSYADKTCSLSGGLGEHFVCSKVRYNLGTDLERRSRCDRNSCWCESQLRELFIHLTLVSLSFIPSYLPKQRAQVSY